MKTYDLIKKLEAHKALHIEFEIQEGVFISPTFHITEVKNVSIESVDCGGNPDSYKQTVIQLWVNPKENFRESWTAKKALSIFNVVDKVKSIDPEAEIFFEYGDEEFRTSQYSIQNVVTTDDVLRIELYARPTVCKPSLVANGASACC